MIDAAITRADVLAAHRALFGRWYLWDGKGPDAFDCSGEQMFVLAMVGGPDLRETHNAQRIADEFQAVDAQTARPGDLLVYGRDLQHVDHVMALMPGGQIYGACGGNSSCVSVSISRALDARVRYRPSVDYRKDLLGFRTLPWGAP